VEPVRLIIGWWDDDVPRLVDETVPIVEGLDPATVFADRSDIFERKGTAFLSAGNTDPPETGFFREDDARLLEPPDIIESGGNGKCSGFRIEKSVQPR